jgi:hypothetical protein
LELASKVIRVACHKTDHAITRLHRQIRSENYEKTTPEKITEQQSMKSKGKRTKLISDSTINTTHQIQN